MARLTEADREEIVASESRKKFHKKLSDLEIKIIDQATKEAEKEYKDRIDMIDEALIDNHFVRTCNEVRVALKHNPNNHECVVIRSRIPVYFNSWGGLRLDNPSSKLSSLIKKKQELREERKAFEKELIQTLRAFTTDKKLIASIPEFKSYFPENGKPTALIPVEQIEKVRKSLAKR